MFQGRSLTRSVLRTWRGVRVVMLLAVATPVSIAVGVCVGRHRWLDPVGARCDAEDVRCEGDALCQVAGGERDTGVRVGDASDAGVRSDE